MISIEVMKEILRTEDIEGYIEIHGAPDDEYDSEAERLANVLNKKLSYPDSTIILQELSKVWQKSFDLDESDLNKRLSNLKVAANRIYSEISKTSY